MRLTPLLSLATLLCLLPIQANAQAEKPTDEQLDHIHWELSSFLKGTTLEIRELVNGPLEQQLARKAEKQKRIADDQAAITAKADAIADSLKASSPAFAALQTQLATAQAQAAAAKQSSDAVAMIKAQDTVAKCQQQIQQLEEPALAKDEEVIAKRKEITTTQGELRNLEPAIANATKARNQIVDGLRNTSKLPGPPGVGKKGVLGSVKPTKIVDGQSFLTDFVAIEVTGEDTKSKVKADGMKNMTGRGHRCQLLVTGVDTSTMHVGTEVLMDRTFSITETQKVGKVDAFVVTPAATVPRDIAIDYLFSKLDDIHKP
jgi:hypothetical protein